MLLVFDSTDDSLSTCVRPHERAKEDGDGSFVSESESDDALLEDDDDGDDDAGADNASHDAGDDAYSWPGMLARISFSTASARRSGVGSVAVAASRCGRSAQQRPAASRTDSGARKDGGDAIFDRSPDTEERNCGVPGGTC